MQRAAEEKGTSMSIGEVISAAREAQGMTQSDLAGKVLVTRQAVSRWETGVTIPGVDMCKLLAGALDLPVTRLLEMPPEPCCQSCALPLSNETDYGAESDGTKSEEYCTWCYPDGSFTGEESLDAFIEHNAPLCGRRDRHFSGRGHLLSGCRSADSQTVGSPVIRRTRSRRARCPSGVGNIG